MHSWGLYNGRYGFSKFVPRTQTTTSICVADAHRPLIDAMLAYEEARQARLKAALAAEEATHDWVEERHLFQNYKQLQFFDTMSLYFHLRHAGERGADEPIIMMFSP